MGYTRAEKAVFSGFGYDRVPRWIRGEKPKEQSLHDFFSGTVIGELCCDISYLPHIKENGEEEYQPSVEELLGKGERENYRWFIESEFFGTGKSCGMIKDRLPSILQANGINPNTFSTGKHGPVGFQVRVEFDDFLFVLSGNFPAGINSGTIYRRSSGLYFNSNQDDLINRINGAVGSWHHFVQEREQKAWERYHRIREAHNARSTFRIDTSGMSDEQQVPDRNPSKSVFKLTKRTIS